ncbi:hypothetical protein KBA63_01570 [Candidatus Woesebacteria bacterium]|nr:hypothetical protein [Candidatus Woesebacteria bacterium]
MSQLTVYYCPFVDGQPLILMLIDDASQQMQIYARTHFIQRVKEIVAIAEGYGVSPEQKTDSEYGFISSVIECRTSWEAIRGEVIDHISNCILEWKRTSLLLRFD